MQLSAPPSTVQIDPVHPAFTDNYSPSNFRDIKSPAHTHGPITANINVGGSNLARKRFTVFGAERVLGKRMHLNGLGDFDYSAPQYSLPFGIGTSLMQSDAQAYMASQGAATQTQASPSDPTAPIKTAMPKPFPTAYVDKAPGTVNTYYPPSVSTPLAPSSPSQTPATGLPSSITQSLDIAPQIPPWLIWGGLGVAALMFYLETR